VQPRVETVTARLSRRCRREQQKKRRSLMSSFISLLIERNNLKNRNAGLILYRIVVNHYHTLTA